MLEGPTEYVNARWMYRLLESYMASNRSCLMVTWIVFQNNLLEVGLTQNRVTMTLRMFTTVDLFYFNMREDPHE